MKAACKQLGQTAVQCKYRTVNTANPPPVTPIQLQYADFLQRCSPVRTAHRRYTSRFDLPTFGWQTLGDTVCHGSIQPSGRDDL